MFPMIQFCLLLSLLHVTTGYSMHTNYMIFIKTMRWSCLLSDKYKFNTNVRDKDHHFAASHQYSNVPFKIQMLEHSKVCSNVEHLFMH